MENFPSSASPRRYSRMYLPDGSTVIGAYGPSVKENDAFVCLSRHFRGLGLPVPEVLSVAGDRLCYLQEDLGDLPLWDAVSGGRASGQYSVRERRLLCSAMAALPVLQVEGARGLDWNICYPQPSFDRRMVMFDLNYFKYCFLKSSGVEFDELLLEEEFGKMADTLCAVPSDVFIHRDFQARNVMLRGDGLVPYFIDFQGGRRGPAHYDVASFVWQAMAAYPDDLKEELIRTYVDSMSRYRDVDAVRFRDELKQFVLFRTLQVLAAYGFRGGYEGKVRFQRSAAFGVENLRGLLLTGGFFGNVFPEYPHLTEIAARLADGIAAGGNDKISGKLVVEVLSFSYMQGIPRDASLNGGGYVFDCRGMQNPGRVPQFRRSTGMDADVAQWLEEKGEVQGFLSAAFTMADPHVERYLDRGLEHLMFSFGCTGGQHRSVYCAERLARHLAEKFAGRRMDVILCHREQNVRRVWHLGEQTAVADAGGPGRVCFIPAAGMGTRLRPLTDYVPKALAPVDGRPMIVGLIDRLYAGGWRKVVVNLHHYADMLEEYLNFVRRGRWDGLEILFSDEREHLLDTGGCLRKAAGMLSDSPFLIHNADIAADVNLPSFYTDACDVINSSSGAAAVLLVTGRNSSRRLLFDRGMRLVGWIDMKTGTVRGPAACAGGVTGPFGIPSCSAEKVCMDGLSSLAFSGISVMNPDSLKLMEGWPDAFSVIDFYLSVCQSMPVVGVKQDVQVTDLGRY